MKSFKMTLGKDKMMSVNGAKSASLSCEKGKLWITGTREGDLMVDCGQKIRLRPVDALVIQSMDDSLFTMDVK
ncbi:DUF2917 domain-containing protein [Geovibrio thiophilus]|uniref:DUF2917 domain-containing protein n=1 Tax=Geovibrio thiophilus TaxID=139438 RepID=UPI0013E35C6D|nr:DUF2917 domain-containing protein [Geovibrio thiophilus]